MRPYLRAANVGWRGLNLGDVKTMNFTDQEMSTYRLVPGDIVIGEASGSADEVGKPALWRGEIADCAFQNTLLRVRTRGAAEPEYLLHWLRYLAMTGAFVQESRGVGIHHIGRAKLARWPVPLPALTEQRRIVDSLEDHLSRLDVAVFNLTVAQRRLMAYRRAGLDEITEARASTHVTLGDVVTRIEAGKSFGGAGRPSNHDEWGIVKVSAMTWGEFRPGENKIVGDASKIDVLNQIHAGDLLVSRANTSEYVGAPVLVRAEPSRLLLSDKSLRLVPRADTSAEYLWRVLSAPRARRQISERSSGNQDSMRNISQATLRRLEIPWTNDQERVIDRANELDVQASRLSEMIKANDARAAALRRALLHAAFAGRLTGHASDVERAEEAVG